VVTQPEREPNSPLRSGQRQQNALADVLPRRENQVEIPAAQLAREVPDPADTTRPAKAPAITPIEIGSDEIVNESRFVEKIGRKWPRQQRDFRLGKTRPQRRQERQGKDHVANVPKLDDEYA